MKGTSFKANYATTMLQTVVVVVCGAMLRSEGLLLSLGHEGVEKLPSSPNGLVRDHEFLLGASMNESPVVQTQSQQMNDAMVLTTMRGTEWRVIEERNLKSPYAAASFGTTKDCKSIATFSGFASDANKGTVSVEFLCPNQDPIVSRGRWVTKPSRIARGSIQLSARWKVRVPTAKGEKGDSVIYKGFIDAEKMIGLGSKSFQAEMEGLLITGEEVGKEKVIGKFKADLIRQLDDQEVDAIKISGGGIYTEDVTLSGRTITTVPAVPNNSIPLSIPIEIAPNEGLR